MILELISFGAIVGLSLGLTGSGGSILAIPLLSYGAGLPLKEVMMVSLLMVAMIAAFGAAKQSASQQVNWRAAILFSLSGMIISPAVVAYTHDINETLRLIAFALLMLIVSWRMAMPKRQSNGTDTAMPNKPKFMHIALGGAIAGAFAGFFGVGGGFIIVPLLTLIFSMPYKQAVGTSLASIAMISSSALFGHFMNGANLNLGILLPFIGGGALGLIFGTIATNKMPETTAKRVFSLVTAALAVLMLIDKLLWHHGGAL